MEQCGYLTRLTKLTKESSCPRFFYAVVISTEFFSYVVRNQKDIKKSKVYLQELRPTNEKVRSTRPAFAAYYVTNKAFHNTPS